MRLSAQARDRLSAMLDQRVFMFKGGYAKADVLNEIADVLASSASFSDLVIEASQVKKRCSLGHWHVIYRVTFRTVLLPALRLLADAGKPLTTTKLIDACEAAGIDVNTARMTGKYFAELSDCPISPVSAGEIAAKTRRFRGLWDSH